MAEIRINTGKIRSNIRKISALLKKHDIQWSLIVKILGAHRETLAQILDEETIEDIQSIGESRISGLKAIKSVRPDIRTMYIKPPAINQAENVVKYADISLNTSLDTIIALNKAAARQKKKHGVIIMVEMGELREGVLRSEVIDFYKKVFKLPHIEVKGIGTNLGCMYGIQPTFDKLIQLSMLKELIELRFKRKLPIVSGGSSITLPLVSKKIIPAGCNHLRIGEAAFLGTSPFDSRKFKDLSDQAFEFRAYIIELEQKLNAPDGVQCDAGVGHASEFDDEKLIPSYKAIVDFGTMDVDSDSLTPKKKGIEFVGTTSDMTVYSLGSSDKGFKVGAPLKFKLDYSGVARLMNSKYITKICV